MYLYSSYLNINAIEVKIVSFIYEIKTKQKPKNINNQSYSNIKDG